MKGIYIISHLRMHFESSSKKKNIKIACMIKRKSLLYSYIPLAFEREVQFY